MSGTFTQVTINAPNQEGLIVTGPVTGIGAGAQLSTVGTGGRGWEILATGQKSAQGQDKLNIRDLGNGQDVLTITNGSNVGIGTTNPGFKLEVDAPNQLGLHVAGPNAGAVGAGISLAAVDPLTAPGSSWEILSTGGAASQGPGRLNIRDLRTGEDILTIETAALAGEGDAVGIGTTTPTQKLEVNGVVLAQNFLVSSSRKVKDNISDLDVQDALAALEHLNPVKFNYKAENAENVRAGFIAEAVPESMASSDRKGVSFTDIVAILTRVVKEQQKAIRALVEKGSMAELAVNGRS